MSSKKLSKKQQQFAGLMFVLAGLSIFFIGLGWGPLKLQDNEAPGWVVSIAGAIFTLAGVMILFGEKSEYNNLMAGVLIAMMGIVGAWVSIFGADENISGGFSFVSSETNFTFARILFGIGAIICYAISIHAFRLHFRNRRNN